MKYAALLLCVFVVCSIFPTWYVDASENADGNPTLEANLKGAKIPSKTDDEVFEREAQAMSSEGLSVAEKRLLEGAGETHHFQAEVSRLMHLIINSLYSNREIFLRELISNASDALDKIRFLSLTDPNLLGETTEFTIRIKADPATKTLHLIDTGIGMTKAELVANLGTIAKSGTSEFLKKMEQSGSDNGLIGQFGVGFYSAFLVAERVTVTSKHPEDSQHVWTSTAEGQFSVVEDPDGNTLGRGTRLSLHLREDSYEYLEQETIKRLVTKYSSFINFPIYLWASHIEERQVKVEPEEEEEDEEIKLEIEEDEEEEEEEEEEDEYETVQETVWDWELLNNVKPLWTRDPKDVTEEEYIQFYQALTKDTQEPFTWTHFHAEGGDIDFRAILYLPSELDENMFDTKNKEVARGVKLYVKRVFITDDFDAIIPKYLAFIKGVVDSSTLPLNVSREILQQDKSLKSMEKKLVRKAIALIQQLAQDDPEKYDDFYDEFRINIKLGILEDPQNKDRLAKLLRFYSSKSKNEQISLEQYIENMKEGQDKIYYLAGESKQMVASSPLLEKLTARGYEVLYLVDAIDEYWTGSLSTFEGKRLVNIAKEGDLGLDEDEDEKEKEEEIAQELKPLCDWIKETLSSRVAKVEVSPRLVAAPSAILSGAWGQTANMERLMRAQALSTGAHFQQARRTLLLNGRHPLVLRLSRLVAEDPENPLAEELAALLFDTASISSGFSIDDPAGLSARIHRALAHALDVDPATFPDAPEAPADAPADAEPAEAEEAEDSHAGHHHDEL